MIESINVLHVDVRASVSQAEIGPRAVLRSIQDNEETGSLPSQVTEKQSIPHWIFKGQCAKEDKNPFIHIIL